MICMQQLRLGSQHSSCAPRRSSAYRKALLDSLDTNKQDRLPQSSSRPEWKGWVRAVKAETQLLTARTFWHLPERGSSKPAAILLCHEWQANRFLNAQTVKQNLTNKQPKTTYEVAHDVPLNIAINFPGPGPMWGTRPFFPSGDST